MISTLSVDYHVPSTSVLASMRDRASSNNVALRTLKVLYPDLIDIGCLSHTIDHVGEKFDTPVLAEFISSWISLFAHSPKNKALWREQTGGRSIQSFSATRWWSRWEVMEQLLVLFGDVDVFLHQDEIGSPATVSKLVGILSDPNKKLYLQIELASVVDFGKPFVTATYNLEGDGPLALSCFEVIEEVRAAISTGYTPNVDGVARKISESTPDPAQVLPHLKAYARQCVQPGLDYFEMQISTNLRDAVSAFKAARLFSPQKVHTMQPTATTIDSLSIFPFLNKVETLSGLKEELPSYIAKCTDVSSSISPVDWWKLNSGSLPKWSSAARKILLVQPSSAAAERVFSLLKASFSEQQQHSLNDYVETSVMLQYNKH